MNARGALIWMRWNALAINPDGLKMGIATGELNIYVG
jgi:hypothetical protein